MRAGGVFFLICLFILAGCKADSPTGPNPTAIQEDIQWPSLGSTPSPIYLFNPQSTGRSKLPGPESGQIKWSIDSLYICSTAAIGVDSSIIFCGMKDHTQYGIYAYNDDGTFRWNYKVPLLTGSNISSTPIIGSDGTIYCNVKDNLIALSKNGYLKWQFPITLVTSALSMDMSGNILFIDGNNTLVSVNKNGTLNWKFSSDNFYSDEFLPLTFSPDGNTIYVAGKRNELAVSAFDINSRSIKWNFGGGRELSQVIADYHGNLYLTSKDSAGKAVYYCLDKNGKVKWQYEISDQYTDQWHTIDGNGNVYFGSSRLYSLNSSGGIRWTHPEDGKWFYAPLISDVENNIYSVQLNGTGYELKKMNSNGGIIFTLSIPEGRFGFAPLITYNKGLILYSYRSNYIYFIQ